MISKIEMTQDAILEIIDESQAALAIYDRLSKESKEHTDYLKKLQKVK